MDFLKCALALVVLGQPLAALAEDINLPGEVLGLQEICDLRGVNCWQVPNGKVQPVTILTYDLVKGTIVELDGGRYLVPPGNQMSVTLGSCGMTLRSYLMRQFCPPDSAPKNPAMNPSANAAKNPANNPASNPAINH